MARVKVMICWILLSKSSMNDSYTNKLRVHISTSLPFEIKIFLNVKLTQKCVEMSQGELLEIHLLESRLLNTFFQNVNCSTEKSRLLESGLTFFWFLSSFHFFDICSNGVEQSRFWCQAVFSSRWILSSWPFSVKITQPCAVKKFKSDSERGSMDRIHLIKKTTWPFCLKGL